MVRRSIRSLFLACVVGAATSNASPCRPRPTDYCKLAEWQNDTLIASLKANSDYAQSVCTWALQPIHTLPSQETRDSEHYTRSDGSSVVIVTVTRTSTSEPNNTGVDVAGTITTLHPATTVIALGPAVTVTEVVQNGHTTLLTTETVKRTTGTTTVVQPASTKTVEVVETFFEHETSIRTVTVDVQTQTDMIYTASTAIPTNTITEIHNRTLTRIETVNTTTTDVVTTGTVIKVAPGATLVVTNFRTFLVHAVVATQTQIAYTATDLIASTYTTVLANSTITTTVEVPTTTVTETTFTNTKTETTFMATNTVTSPTTVQTNDWTTDYRTEYVDTATEIVTYYTQHAFPWWGQRKRSLENGRGPNVSDDELPEERWLSDFGETHFSKACSCIVTFPLPTRVITDTTSLAATADDGHTPVVTSTAYITRIPTLSTNEIQTSTTIASHGAPITVTSATTVTETVTLNGTASISIVTVTEDVLETVFSTPLTEITLVQHVTETEMFEATQEVSHTDMVTLYGVKTGYTWIEITRTEDIWEIQTRLHPVGKTVEVAATSTSFFTTTIETEVATTSTVLETADETVGAIYTSVDLVAVTDVNTFVYTATVFTHANTTISMEATSTVGVVATSTAVVVLTVKNGVTSTITSLVETTSTVTAHAVATQTCAIPIADGDMSLVPKGKAPIPIWNQAVTPWRESYYSKYAIYKEDLTKDAAHKWVLGTDYLYTNGEAKIYQDATTCAGVRFRCSYEFYFDKYYEVQYVGDDTWYVPYFRIYWNDELVGERWPVSSKDTGKWMTGSIEFTATGGGDTLWIRAASPQEPKQPGKPKDPNRGENFIRWDNFVCRPIQYNS